MPALVTLQWPSIAPTIAALKLELAEVTDTYGVKPRILNSKEKGTVKITFTAPHAGQLRRFIKEQFAASEVEADATIAKIIES